MPDWTPQKMGNPSGQSEKAFQKISASCVNESFPLDVTRCDVNTEKNTEPCKKSQ